MSNRFPKVTAKDAIRVIEKIGFILVRQSGSAIEQIKFGLLAHERQPEMSGGFMKMESNEEICPEYDFSNMKGGVRGKYVDRYQAGTNIVLLEPDVAQAFLTSDSVNEALRLLMQIAQRQKPNTTLKPTSQI